MYTPRAHGEAHGHRIDPDLRFRADRHRPGVRVRTTPAPRPARRAAPGRLPRSILVNSNPATIMTDPEFADRTYVEPLVEYRGANHRAGAAGRPAADRRRPDRAQPGDGAGRAGVLEDSGVTLIGAGVEALRLPEDRQLFKGRWSRPGSRCRRAARNDRSTKAREICVDASGFPVIVRPSFTLGGEGGGMAYNRRGDRGGRSAAVCRRARFTRSCSRSRSSAGRSSSSR